MKDIEAQRQARERLEAVLRRVPFLKVVRIEASVSVAGRKFDLIAEVAVGEKKPWTLVCEIKGNPRPSVALMGVTQLHSLCRHWPSRSYGVLITPFVSDGTRAICLEHDVGYLDLAGNCRLSFDHVFIESTGHKTHAPSPKRLYPALFGVKSARVLRWLLRHSQESWKVQDLARETGVSLGLVSNVRRALLEQGWAASGESGLRLVNPDALLEAWRKAYSRPVVPGSLYYDTLLHGQRLDEAISRALTEAGEGGHALLAGFSAAQWIAPYGRTGYRQFYTDATGQEILSKHLKLLPVYEADANVVLERLTDDGVFLDRIQPAPSLWCTSPVQTYLDLTTLGERGREAADHLRREVLTPMWGKR